MKTQDFMKALGGVSQEKLDALAAWQDASTPITGKSAMPEEQIMQTAVQPVSAQRRKGTMKKKASVTHIFAWNIGVGAAVAACAVVAVSIGKESVLQHMQMQDSSSAGASVSELIPAHEPKDEIQSAKTVKHEPVKLIDRLYVTGGSDHVMMQVPPEGTVLVLRSTADAEACCQYTDKTIVAGQEFDFSTILTEDIFSKYDVLYCAFKDYQVPLYFHTYDMVGGSIAADGKTLTLDFHALMYPPEQQPTHALRSYEPDWNTYYFYTVPKDSLPDLQTLEMHFEKYQIGALPDELLVQNTESFQKHLETMQEYQDYIKSIPQQLSLTWADVQAPPEQYDETEAVTAD